MTTNALGKNQGLDAADGSSGRVQFPRQFLVLSAIRDYQNITKAIARELLQNSKDAKSSVIDFTIRTVINASGEERVVLECRDNGVGMNRETIETKLMAMGGTTKEGDADAVGALGVAKLACYFCHDEYTVATREWLVSGSGSDYTVSRAQSPIKGCHSTIVLNPLVVKSGAESLVSIYRAEIARSYLPGLVITINGVEVQAACKPGRRVHDFGSGVTLHRRALPAGETTNYVSVRARGLFLFDQYVNESKYEISVELQSFSAEILTSNRDGFRDSWSNRVSSLIQQMLLNSNIVEKTKVHHYVGHYSRQPADLGSVIKSLNETLARSAHDIRQVAKQSSDNTPQGSEEGSDKERIIQANFDQADSMLRSEAMAIATKNGLSEEEASALANQASRALRAVSEDTGANLVLIKEEDLDLGSRPTHHYYAVTKGKFRSVPAKWRDENLSPRHRMLLETWADVVALVLAHSGRAPKSFNVGFMLDDGSENKAALAAYTKLDGGHVFLLNPLSSGGETADLPLTKSSRLALVMYLKALAEHEVTHFLGRQWHDESFVGAEMSLRRQTAKAVKDYLALAEKSAS